MKITKILFTLEMADQSKAEYIHKVLKSIQDGIENKKPNKSVLKMITENHSEIDPPPPPINYTTESDDK